MKVYKSRPQHRTRDPIAGLTYYHGLVAGSVGAESNDPQRIFAPVTGASEIASPCGEDNSLEDRYSKFLSRKYESKTFGCRILPFDQGRISSK